MIRNELRNKLIETNKLYMAEVRFYNGNKVEVGNSDTPNVILIEVGNHFYNIITGEEHLFLKMAPYSNCSRDGVEYGTKLIIQNKELLDLEGICLVEVKNKFIEDIRENDVILYDNLENKILNDVNFYFQDRVKLLEDRLESGPRIKQKRKIIQLATNDWLKNYKFNEIVYNRNHVISNK